MLPDAASLGGVLFDLDGTFADTAGDLAYALNKTLVRYRQAPLPFATIRPFVSHGAAALVRRGFAMAPDDPGFEERRRYLLDVYRDNLCRETRLFDGLDALLQRLEQGRIPWGIVTNKPAWLTDPLMNALGMTPRAASIVSGDTCANRKPHPEPILHACAEMAVDPARCVYVGDAERDIVAGRAAGTPTVAALYGYLLPEDTPESWNADASVTRPSDLAAVMGLAP
jgi:phosphoglycolate phosphatase